MKTDHFKPGDKCFIVKATNPSNIGKIVTVVRFCHEAGSNAGNVFEIPENGEVLFRKTEDKPSYVVYSETGILSVNSNECYKFWPTVYDRLVKIIDPDEVEEFDKEVELNVT